MRQRRRIVLFALVLVALVLALWKWRSDVRDTTSPEVIAREEAAEAPSELEPPRLRGAPAPPPVEPEVVPEPAPPSDVGKEMRVVEGKVLDVATKAGVPYVRVVGGWGTYDGETQKMGRRVFETEADRDGNFRLEMQGASGVLGILEIADPGWRAYRWYARDDEDASYVRLESGRTTQVVLWVRKTFRLTGVVEDRDENPLKGAQLGFSTPVRRGTTHHVMSAAGYTDEDGRFDIGPLDVDPYAGLDEAAREHFERYALVTVEMEGYATIRLDPRSIPESERDRVRITLTQGVTLAGVLLDEGGLPVPAAVVAAEYGDDWELRRATRTDEAGRWRLETVTPVPMVLRARSFARDLKYEQEMTPREDDQNMRLVAETIRLSGPPQTVRALGLELVDVDDEIRAAYGVPEYIHVLIWHPGDDPEALGIGRLEKGYGLMMVGKKRIQSIDEAVEEFLAEPEGANSAAGPLGRRKRVVYTFWNERFAGTNTQYVSLTDEWIGQLRVLRERRKR